MAAVISRELEAEILRLYHAEHWPIGTVARQLHVHHATVRRVLTQAGIPAVQQSARRSMADPFVPFIQEILTRYPTLRASRLYHMVRERGYPGRPDHFRAIVARHRPRPPVEAYLRLRTLAGEQSQVDWAHFMMPRVRLAFGTAIAMLDAGLRRTGSQCLDGGGESLRIDPRLNISKLFDGPDDDSFKIGLRGAGQPHFPCARPCAHEDSYRPDFFAKALSRTVRRC